MGYREVKINDMVDKLVGLIDNAKKSGDYDGAHWDDLLIAGIEDESKKAEQNTEAHRQYYSEWVSGAKQYIKEIEARLKGSGSFGQPDLDYVKDRVVAVHGIATDAKNEAEDYLNAMFQYRGAWDTKARDSLSNPKLIAPFKRMRMEAINDRTILDLAERLKEYVSRVDEYQKQATQRAKEGAVEIEEFRAEAEDFEAKMGRHLKEIEGFNTSANTSWDLQSKAKLNPKKPTEDDLTIVQSRHAKIASDAKKSRGHFKTMKIEFEGMKKRSEKAGPGWKGLGLDAVKSAKKTFEKAEKFVKDTDEIEDKIEKLLETIKKNLK